MADTASWGIKAELDYIRQLKYSDRIKVRGVSFMILLTEYINVHQDSSLGHHLAGVTFAKQLLKKYGIEK